MPSRPSRQACSDIERPLLWVTPPPIILFSSTREPARQALLETASKSQAWPGRSSRELEKPPKALSSVRQESRMKRLFGLKPLTILDLAAFCAMAGLLFAKAWIDMDYNWDSLGYHVPFAALRTGLVSPDQYICPPACRRFSTASRSCRTT